MKQIILSLLLLFSSTLGYARQADDSKTKTGNMSTEKKCLVAFFSRADENYAVGYIEKGNTHIVAEMIAAATGADMFHKVQGQTEKVPRKPSPIGALTIAEEFGVRPVECLYMGDTDTDMETGHGAGMFTIGVTWGFRPRKELEDHKADLIVDRPEEILEFVKKDKNPGKS